MTYKLTKLFYSDAVRYPLPLHRHLSRNLGVPTPESQKFGLHSHRDKGTSPTLPTSLLGDRTTSARTLPAAVSSPEQGSPGQPRQQDL